MKTPQKTGVEKNKRRTEPEKNYAPALCPGKMEKTAPPAPGTTYADTKTKIRKKKGRRANGRGPFT